MDKREKLLSLVTKMLPNMGLPPEVLDLFQDEPAPSVSTGAAIPRGYGLVQYPLIRQHISDQHFREIAEAILSDPACAQLAMDWADAFFAMGERLRAAYEKKGAHSS